MAYTWPPTLPQTVQQGYTESIGLNILRTPMDSGPAKLRLRGRKPDTLKVSFVMTSAQVTILNNFINSTIYGVRRFDFPHPRLKTTTSVRIIPSNDNVYYSLEYMMEGFYKVSLDLEVIL